MAFACACSRHWCEYIACIWLVSVTISRTVADVPCTVDKKPSDGYFEYCYMTVDMPLVYPDRIGYGNGGYPRVEGVLLRIKCLANFATNHTNGTSDTVEYTGKVYAHNTPHSESRILTDGTILEMSEDLLAKPGAQYHCRCITSKRGVTGGKVVPPEDISCWRTDPFVVPKYRRCHHQQCALNSDKDFCYEHTNAHTIANTRPDTSCSPYARMFDKGCQRKKVERDFFLDTQTANASKKLESGTMHYKMENETWTLRTECLPFPAVALSYIQRCFLMGGKNDSLKEQYQSIKLRPKTIKGKNDACNTLNYKISPSTIAKLNSALNTSTETYIIGCESKLPADTKFFEIYMEVLKPVTVEMDEARGPTCKMQLHNDEGLTVYPVGVSADKCVCMFEMVACTPQVAVTHINHTFKCDASALPTTTAIQKTTDSDSPGNIIDPTQGEDKQKMWMMLLIGFAGLMLVMTVAIIAIMMRQSKKKENGMGEAEVGFDSGRDVSVTQALDTKPHKIVLDPSMFQKKDEGDISPINRLTFMEEVQADQVERSARRKGQSPGRGQARVSATPPSPFRGQASKSARSRGKSAHVRLMDRPQAQSSAPNTPLEDYPYVITSQSDDTDVL